VGNLRLEMVGNQKLFDGPLVAFLSSKNYTQGERQAAIAWARDLPQSTRVISGFESGLETEVLTVLLQKGIHAIWVLARGIFDEIPYQFQAAIEGGRLLIVSPFSNAVTEITRDLALVRNALVISKAEKVVVGSITPGGLLEKSLAGATFTQVGGDS
jgi:predicted Rossmann fold nucleotide-binding protein DprA/Smf involved in DNA uptake